MTSVVPEWQWYTDPPPFAMTAETDLYLRPAVSIVQSSSIEREFRSLGEDAMQWVGADSIPVRYAMFSVERAKVMIACSVCLSDNGSTSGMIMVWLQESKSGRVAIAVAFPWIPGPCIWMGSDVQRWR